MVANDRFKNIVTPPNGASVTERHLTEVRGFRR